MVKGYQFRGNTVSGFIRSFYRSTAKVQITLCGKHHENQCTSWWWNRSPWFSASNFAVLYFPSHFLHSWWWRNTEAVECTCQVICFPLPAKNKQTNRESNTWIQSASVYFWSPTCTSQLYFPHIPIEGMERTVWVTKALNCHHTLHTHSKSQGMHNPSLVALVLCFFVW